MFVELEKMKMWLNPKDSRGGARIIASFGNIPWVHSGAYIPYDGTISISGSTSIDMGSHVREGTVVSNTKIGRWTSVQDHCVLIDCDIGNWVTVAHGGKAIKAVIGDRAHLNISAWIGNNCFLAEGAFLMANCRIRGLSSGKRYVPGNICIHGNDSDGFGALSNAVLNPDFTVRSGNIRKIFFDKDDDLGDTSLIMTFQRDDHLQLSEGQGNNRKLTLADWVTNYSGVQINKHTEFMCELLSRYNFVAAYDAQIKADILLLAATARFLRAMGENESAQGLEDMARAFGYLISAHKLPVTKRIKDAFKNSALIIERAMAKLARNNDMLKISCNMTEEAADVFNSQIKPDAVLLFSPERIRHYGLRLSEVKDRVDELAGSYKERAAEVSIKCPEVDSAKRFKQLLNPNMCDVTKVEGATGVRSHYGHTPQISPGAKFIGCLLRGIVEVGNGHFANCSIANENANSKVTCRLDDGVVMLYTTVHTATKETEPVFVTNTIATGTLNDRVFIHGAKIGQEGETLLAPCVLGDGEVFSGIAFNNALGPGQNISGWGYILPARELSNRVSPKAISAKLLEHWSYTPFSDIEPSDIAAMQKYISQLRDSKRCELDEIMENMVAKHGVIFQYSPHLQALAQQLYFGGHVLKSCDDKNAQTLFNLSEALEYVIGIRERISASAAVSLERFKQDKNYMVESAVALLKVAATYDDVEVAVPRIRGEYSPSPLFDSDQPEHIRKSLQPNDSFQKFISPSVIEERMCVSASNMLSISAAMLSACKLFYCE